MLAQRVLLTYQDYAELPDDGKRYELHEGVLSVGPAPGTGHQLTSGELFVPLYAHVNSNRLGKLFYAPVDCILDDSTIVQPDLVFIDNSRLGLISDRGVEGPPTLVVEIISPSSRQIDLVRKFQLYAAFKVPYYWIVDSEARAIDAYVLDETAGTYQLALRASGPEPVVLPPFEDLALVPDSIWA